MPVKNIPVYDVIIVGGGIAGFHMARKCVQDGLNILLLEKEDRYGGRIDTKYKKGPDHDLQYECGPARISWHHTKSLALIKEFKLPTATLQPFKKHRYINPSNGSVSILKDVSQELTNKVLMTVHGDPQKYNELYLQSIDFRTLCSSILGDTDGTALQAMFGYDAEFKYCNANDAVRMFKRDFQEVGTYVVVPSGLSSLINAIEKDIAGRGATFLKSITVTNFSYSSLEKVATVQSIGGDIYQGRSIVWAVPQKALREISGWTLEQRKLFDTVTPISLHRIFCQFPYDKNTGKSWVSNLERTTTNDALRQCIPMASDKGFVQFYNDSYYADYWNHYFKLGTLHKELLIHLRIVFPDMTTIDPKYIDSQYWKEGVHMWRPGVNSTKINKYIQHIGGNTPIYIVGEAYSMHQCWIEGALETADEVFKMLKNDLDHKVIWQK